MPKRFTATEKWADPWFRALTPEHKLGWLYLCDNCDLAGVIDLDIGLANFQVGVTVDWNALLDAAAGRIERLDCGKLWLSGFVQFQYGAIGGGSKVHLAVSKILDKYSLRQRLSKGYQVGIPTHQDKDKDKDKDKEIRKGDARGKPKPASIEAANVLVPDGFDTAEVRTAIAAWLDFKAKRGEAYKDAAYFSRKINEFNRVGPAAFVAAVDSSIGNNYAGLFPAKEQNGKPSATRVGSGQRHVPGRHPG